MTAVFDAVVPIADRDLAISSLAVRSVRTFVEGVRNIYVVCRNDPVIDGATVDTLGRDNPGSTMLTNHRYLRWTLRKRDAVCQAVPIVAPSRRHGQQPVSQGVCVPSSHSTGSLFHTNTVVTSLSANVWMPHRFVLLILYSTS